MVERERDRLELLKKYDFTESEKEIIERLGLEGWF